MIENTRELIQFIHFETYALKKTRTKTSLVAVFEELIRNPNYSKHVKQIIEPRPIYLNSTFSKTKDLNQYKVEMLKFFRKMQNKSLTYSGRQHRTDASIALCGVVSFPFEVQELQQEHVFDLYCKFVELSKEFLIQEYSDNLLSIVEHLDESYPHLHYCVRGDMTYDSNMKLIYSLKRVCPQKRIKYDNKDLTIDEQSILIKEELSYFQDRYYERVSKKLNFKRKGNLPRLRIYDYHIYIALRNKAKKAKKLELELVGITLNKNKEEEQKKNKINQGEKND